MKFPSKTGSPTRKVFSGKVEEDGSITLVEVGKENIYEYIQSFKDSVDIGTILKKAGLGDMSGLQRVQGFYADVTKFPRTNAEMLQLILDSKGNFDKLPLEIKENFDNDFNKFFATMDSEEWYEKMKMKPVESVKEEVTKVESE